MPTRFLNFHTPDARFADHLRELHRGEPGGFDSVDARGPGDGLTATGAVLLHAGEGEALRANNRVATIKIGTDDLCLIEFEPSHARGPRPPQPHRSHRLLLRARRHGRLPARRREDRGRPGVVRRRATRSRPRLHDRPERRPHAQPPRAEHGLSRAAARNGLGHSYRCTTVSTNGAPARSGGSKSHANRPPTASASWPACAAAHRKRGGAAPPRPASSSPWRDDSPDAVDLLDDGELNTGGTTVTRRPPGCDVGGRAAVDDQPPRCPARRVPLRGRPSSTPHPAHACRRARDRLAVAPRTGPR